MNHRHEAIQHAHSSFGTPEEDCDPALAQAVVVCLKSFKLNDSLHSKWPSRSIPTKVAKHVDPVFREFAKRQGHLPTGWSDLSELMHLDQGHADWRLDMWWKAMFAEGDASDTGTPSEELCQDLDVAYNRRYDQVASTIDTLRNFNLICHMYWPVRLPAKAFNAESGVGLVYDGQRRRSKRALGSHDHLFWMLSHEPWCALCCNRTEKEQQKDKLIAQGKLTRNDEMVRQSELSESFCPAHLPKSPLYRRDHERQWQFYAVMRLIIEVRLAMDLRALDPESLRSVAHALVMESPRVPKSVKAWTQFLLDLPEPAELSTPAMRTQLLAFHALIVHEAKSRKFNLRRAMRRGIENRNDMLKRFRDAGVHVVVDGDPADHSPWQRYVLRKLGK